MILSAILAIFLCWPNSLRAERWKAPDNFRGIKFGTPFEEVNKMLGNQLAPKGSEGFINHWSLKSSIAAVAVDITYLFVAGSFQGVSISFNSNYWTDIRDALIERYGGPSATDYERLQNPFGMEIVGEVLIWFDEQSLFGIAANQYSGTTKKGLLLIATRVVAKASEEHRKEKAKEGAKEF